MLLYCNNKYIIFTKFDTICMFSLHAHMTCGLLESIHSLQGSQYNLSYTATHLNIYCDIINHDMHACMLYCQYW